MAACVLPPLKRQGYMIEVISATPNHAIFYHNPMIDKLSVIDVNIDLNRDKPVEWQKWFHRRSLEGDVFVHLSHSCEMEHCLLPEQTAFWWPPDVRRARCAGNYLETAQRIAQVPFEFGHPLFFPSDAERELAMKTRQQIGGSVVIGWVMSGSRLDRHYPYSAITIARLIKELDASVIITGVPTEEGFKEAKEVMAEVTKRNGSDKGFILATSPDTSLTWGLRRSLTQLQYCDLVISPDTGPPWAVAFEQVPKVMMLSNSSVENVTKHWTNTITLHADQTRVPCYPCHRLHQEQSTCVINAEKNGAKCITDISVECLVTAAKAGLGDIYSMKSMQSEFKTNLGGMTIELPGVGGAGHRPEIIRVPDVTAVEEDVTSGEDRHSDPDVSVDVPIVRSNGGGNPSCHLDTGLTVDRDWPLDKPEPMRVLDPSSADGKIRIATGNRVLLEVVAGGTAFAEEVARRLNGENSDEAA
jgi:ADP-heptose:LPS heptosyltransferase